MILGLTPERSFLITQMPKMASFSAARSIFRSTSSARNAAARFEPETKASPPASPCRSSANKPFCRPIFSYGWLLEACNDDV